MAKAIREKIYADDANYSTIIFKSAGDAKCVINNDIVWALIYSKAEDYTYEPNSKLTKLDLGDVIVKEFTGKTFGGEYGNAFKYKSYDNEANTFGQLIDVTLPLVEAKDGETTVPSYAFKGKDNSYTNAPVCSITIPEGYTKIDENAFHTTKELTTVNFPSTLKAIGKSAFAICTKYVNITLNNGLKTIGNCAFYTNQGNIDGMKVLSIPASVEYMGPGAFAGRLYRDVYYYSSKAPVSPWGSLNESSYTSASTFNKVMYVGESGYNEPANGYTNRENYVNSMHFAVLHFPTGLSDENRETFTDITRTYKTWTGKYEGKGNSANQYTVGSETEVPTFDQTSPGVAKVVDYGFHDTEVDDQYIWPSQSQFTRSYAVNSNGLKWDGVTTYTPTLTEEQIKMIKDDVSSLADKSDDEIKKVAYLGTRQFTLLDQDVNPDSKSDELTTTITSGSRWWTLCVPCDVTKAEVDRVFGSGTHLCLFSKVERKEDTANGNELHLYFQNDTYKNKYTRATDGTWTKGDDVTGEDDVVLYAHTPYMIYPTQNPSDGSAFVLKNFEMKEGDVQSTVVAANGTKSDEAVKYSFIGNYRSGMTIPQYSYVYGKKGNGKSQFYIYAGTKGTWASNKCLVKRTDNSDADYTTFFKGSSDGAKQISTFGDEEGDVTAIERVEFHYGDEASAPVYSLSGQKVNTANGLAKGLYIKGGKKFVVK